MQKVQFKCEQCDAKGTIRLPDECNHFKIESCPCCGSSLDLDDDYDDE